MRRIWIRSAFLLLAALTLAAGSVSAQGLSTSETYRQAYDRGYAEGYEAGTADRDGGRPFEYANKRLFQRADHGFDSSRHDREIYRVAFRRGFEDGYEDGFELRDDVTGASGPVIENQPDSSGTGGAALPQGTEIKIKLLDTVSTQRNERGDRVRAEVMEDILVGRQVGIPKGTRIIGEIAALRRPGRIKGRAEMTLTFKELELPGGQRIPIEATVVSIEPRSDSEVQDEGTIQGEASKGEDAQRVGTAAGIGAVIGVLTGGRRGAQSGAAAGGITGVAGILLTRGRDLRLYSETELLVRLDKEVVLPTN